MNIIFKSGKVFVEETEEESPFWVLRHEGIEGEIAKLLVESKTCEKKYKKDPATFAQKKLEQRIKGIDSYIEKLNAQANGLSQEKELLKQVNLSIS